MVLLSITDSAERIPCSVECQQKPSAPDRQSPSRPQEAH